MFVITATIRDLAIIFLALESIVVLALLGILIWQIWRLTKMMQTEVRPIVPPLSTSTAQKPEFVGENMVTPIMRADPRVAAFRRTVQVLAADLPFQRSKKPSAPAAPPAAPAAVSVTPDGAAADQRLYLIHTIEA